MYYNIENALNNLPIAIDVLFHVVSTLSVLSLINSSARYIHALKHTRRRARRKRDVLLCARGWRDDDPPGVRRAALTRVINAI